MKAPHEGGVRQRNGHADHYAARRARKKESDEIRPGVIADFGYDGGVVGFEILQASKVVEQAGEMQFAVAG